MRTFDFVDIGKRLKFIRKKKGYNQTELAKLLNRSLRTIQKYESGEIEMSMSVIDEIAEVLEVPVEELLGYEKNMDSIRSFADIVNFLFYLDKVTTLDFSIDVKKPAFNKEWSCSICFDGKSSDAVNNSEMCLFLEAWEHMRKSYREYAISQQELHDWQNSSLDYYAATHLECDEGEPLSEEERNKKRTELAVRKLSEYVKKHDNE